MKILKALWVQLARFGHWMNTNATKRWLLALDRFCICFLITMIYGGVREEIAKSGQYTVYDLALVGGILLFLVLYTPSYMFPSSHESVSGYYRDHLDSDSLDEKK